ncbi:hypothetical protein LBW94_037520 [Nocardia sp. alder85J]|nr:hypothetical protein [Nocardia sp. alder85J]MCX4098063.1 hypothetical protein [Nocardia sp. alder85J]
MSRHLLLKHIQPLEDRLVQSPSYLVACPLVQPVGIAQQLQAGLKERCPFGQVQLYLAQFCFQPFPFARDLRQPGSDLGSRQFAVFGQADQVGFLGVQLLELVLQLLAVQALCCFALGQHRFQTGLHGRDELRREGDRLVVLDHGVFDSIDVVIRRVTASVLLVADAEEVQVLPTVPPSRALHDHAPDSLVQTTLATEQRSLEVVVEYPAAFTSYAVLIEHPLHPAERLVVHQRCVSAWNLFLAFVGDDADVVVVAEEACPLLGCHDLWGALRGPPGA